MEIPLIKPFINQEIKDKVLEVLESGYLTEGPVTKLFENKLRDFIGCNYVHTVTSATTGLEVALRVLGIGPGDEVIVPDYTYPATASVVNIVGAKAVIVDVSKEDMLINVEAIENAINENTKAIIPVSLFGAPLNYDLLNELKTKHDLYIVEDAACSIGAIFKGVRVGNQADITVFSLHPRKFITTGEGGVITTDNEEWSKWIDSYKHFGMDTSNENREGIHFNIIGTNYKLTNVQSAIGLGQMDCIEKLLSKRIKLANNYKDLVFREEKISLPKILVKKPDTQHSFQTYIIYVEDRDRVMKEMRSKGIEVQIGSYSLHMHDAFRNNPQVELCGKLSNSKWCYEHALALPLYNDLTCEQQEYIVKELEKTL